MKIKFEKDKFSASIPGTSNAVFYAYAIIDGKRRGTVWNFKDDGRYAFNEDFDRRKHDKENRPVQVVRPTLAELRKGIESTIS